MSSMLLADNFSSLSVLHLSSPSHLLPPSCSPDKDLLLVISRLGIKDTISLWKMQGAKKWEVDVSVGNAAHEEVTGIAWSPNGMSILISHHPPRLSIHSIQDGRQERSVSFLSISSSDLSVDFRVTGVWWHKHENPPRKGPEMPDFFKRNKTIPGSALSQLKMQPLLDPLKDDTQPITTSDLFSFQGALPTSTAKAPKLPDSIADWPVLPPDLVAASIKPFPRPGDPQRRPGGPPEEILDDVRAENSLNYDSLVIATDDQCRCHFFMDATFPLGHLPIGEVAGGVLSEVASLMNPPFQPAILAHVTHRVHEQGYTNLVPLSVDLSSLRTPEAREVAKASSAARELAWYMIRVVEEMRIAWMGSSEQGEGAHTLGPKWIKELEAKQRAHHADKEPNAFVDLTALLTTGRASEALSDILGGLSERGLSKWETTMTDAFVKLRDFAEKRIALASQRLHIILQEVKGWAKSPRGYAVYGFNEVQIDSCLALVHKAIILSAWLASTAREQLWRFKEFKIWLQYESNKVHTDDGKVRIMSWDILEVNRYLIDGLNGCNLDKWFDADEGENRVPTITPDDLRAPPPSKTLAVIMGETKEVLDDPQRLAWESTKKHADIKYLDRNLEQVVKEIAKACREVFADTGRRVGQTTVVHKIWPAPSKKGKEKEVENFRMRERTTIENGLATQYVLVSVPRRSEREGHLCLSRMQFRIETPLGDPTSLQVAAISCRVENVNETVAVDVLDFEFFDDESIVLVLKPNDDDARGAAFVGTVAYRDLEFTQIDAGPKLGELSREKLVNDVILGGDHTANPLRLTGSRKLCLRSTESASLAVNGRVGRRTVCVLDGKGVEVEVLDLDEEEEEMGD